MESTNRRWQDHLKAKGIVPFFLDRLQSHALSSAWQHENGAFHFPIGDREVDDALSEAYFDWVEAFPYEIFVEVTNRCNLACAMCAHPVMRRPVGTMSLPLFRKIIDEIAEKQPHAFLHYTGIGEALLDKRVFHKLDYARRKGVRNSVFITNGQLLYRKGMCQRLAESGVATIVVDLDGFSPESYARIRVGGDFARAKQGITGLYDHVRANRLNVRIEISYQVYPGITDEEIPQFVEWCENGGYEYKLISLHNWAGMREDLPSSALVGMQQQHHKGRRGPCKGLWSTFFITWDGRVALCYQDADLSTILGDVSRQSIEDVWRGSHLRKRQDHVAGRFKGICTTCDSFTGVHLPKYHSQLYPPTLRDGSR